MSEKDQPVHVTAPVLKDYTPADLQKAADEALVALGQFCNAEPEKSVPRLAILMATAAAMVRANVTCKSCQLRFHYEAATLSAGMGFTDAPGKVH